MAFANKDDDTAYKRRWYQENKDRILAIREARRPRVEKKILSPDQRREKQREAAKAYNARADIKIRHAAANKLWREKNPEKSRAIKLNRRARLEAAGQCRHGRISAADIEQIVSRQKGRCAVCKGIAKLEMDHIMPLALGGSGDKTNFQGLCRPCNTSKRARHPIDFNRSRGLLL